MRRSHLHVPLGADAIPGLSDYLCGTAEDAAVMQFAKDPSLCFIPAGNAVSKPSELLSSGRLKILLDRFADLFDWIIVDSPPCLPVADAAVLAEHSDGSLLIIRANSTPTAIVLKAAQELQNRKVVGVVLNSVDEQAIRYGSYYWSVYYGRDREEAVEVAQIKAREARNPRSMGAEEDLATRGMQNV